MCNILNFYTMHLHTGPILRSLHEYSVGFQLQLKCEGLSFCIWLIPKLGLWNYRLHLSTSSLSYYCSESSHLLVSMLVLSEHWQHFCNFHFSQFSLWYRVSTFWRLQLDHVPRAALDLLHDATFTSTWATTVINHKHEALSIWKELHICWL